MKLRKLLLATVGATVLLGALISSASARNFSVSNQFFESNFRAITFINPFGSIVCEVHLDGSLHRRTLAKRVGSLIGYITQAEFGGSRCTTNRATILRETLPWHVRYLGFAGALPNITQVIVNVIRAAFRIATESSNCLVTSTETNPLTITFGQNLTSRIFTIARIGGTLPTGGGCFQVGTTLDSDDAPVFLLNSTTRITLTLI